MTVSISPGAGRRRLTANLTLNVDPATGNDSNDGSSGSPFATIQKAINVLLYNVDLAGFTGSILLADGTYTEHVVAIGAVIGNTSINIGGATGHQASVLWQIPFTGTTIGVYAKDFCAVSLHDITFSGTTAVIAVSPEQDAIIDIGANIVFGDVGSLGTHIYIQDAGHVNITASYSITGSANFHILNQGGKLLYGSSLTVTGSSSLTITNFLYSTIAGKNFIPTGFTASGFASLTGAKGAIINGASILTNGTDPDTFIPGTTNMVYGMLPTDSRLLGGGGGAFQMIGYATGVNFNSANTDTAVKINLPSGFTQVAGIQVHIYGASHTLVTATCGLFTATGGGGNAILAAGAAITVSATADATNNNFQIINGTNFGTTAFMVAAGTTWQFRVGTAEGAAATGTIAIYARVLP